MIELKKFDKKMDYFSKTNSRYKKKRRKKKKKKRKKTSAVVFLGKSKACLTLSGMVRDRCT